MREYNACSENLGKLDEKNAKGDESGIQNSLVFASSCIGFLFNSVAFALAI